MKESASPPSRADLPPGAVRWGLLGTGRVAGDFAQGLRVVPGAALAAVGSRSAERAAGFAAAFGARRAHGSYESLVADPEVDAVYVATPHVRHKDDSLLALAAGKAVLCEKPFAANAAEGEEVVREARRRGLFCMEAMWMRFIPAVRTALELARSGAIGEVRMLTADFGAPTRFDPANRFFDPALGGGALLDRGVYPLSLAFSLFGPPEEVRSVLHLASTGVDEHAAILLRHPGGRVSVLSATLTGFAANEAVLIGTEGRLTIHEPLCRPDRITLRRAPIVGAGDGWSAPASLPRRVTAALRHNALLRRARSLLVGCSGSISVPFENNGYGHQAAEVGRCLAAGLKESSIMPLDETLAILRTLDRVRA